MIGAVRPLLTLALSGSNAVTRSSIEAPSSVSASGCTVRTPDHSTFAGRPAPTAPRAVSTWAVIHSTFASASRPVTTNSAELRKPAK